MKLSFTHPHTQNAIALCAGALNVLGFAPFGWWWVGLLSLGVLFGLWLDASRKRAAQLGFCYGLGLFGCGISWMYVSLSTYGGMAWGLAGFCIAVLVAGMALYPAMVGYAQACFARLPAGARLVCVSPALWLGVEWLRGWLLSGFPWLTSGYAMLDTPLANFAPLGGVYLVSLLALVSVGAGVRVLLGWRSRRRGALPAGALPLTLVVALWLGGWLLGGTDARWSAPHGTVIRVALIQNNVALGDKWLPDRAADIVRDYLRMSEQVGADADLVVWPEAALPDYLDRAPPELLRQLRQHPADFIVGVLTRAEIAGEIRHYNSIAAFTPQSLQLYRKQHLVPFGEYMPLRAIFAPLFATLQIPMSNFSPWRGYQAPLRAAGTTFAASICYEDAFPQKWRAQVPHSGLLINLSEDAWFGDSLAPHQRLQMARFRALESQRSMLRASNNGLSAVIDWRGEIQQVAPQFARAVVVAYAQPRRGLTPYIRYGNLPALGLALLLVCGGLAFSTIIARPD